MVKIWSKWKTGVVSTTSSSLKPFAFLTLHIVWLQMTETQTTTEQVILEMFTILEDPSWNLDSKHKSRVFASSGAKMPTGPAPTTATETS